MKFGIHSVNLNTCAYPSGGRPRADPAARGEVVVADAATLLERCARGVHLRLAPADAEAEDDATVRHHVERRQLLGQDDGLALRQDDDTGRERDARRVRREERQRDDRLDQPMQALWTQPKPAYQGPYVSFDGVQAMPRPVQTPIPIVVGGRTPPAYRRAVSKGHGWYGFGLDVAETQKCGAALGDAAKKVARSAGLGKLEISVTPPGYDVPDKAMRDAYAAAGVDRLILRPRPEMDAAALERFAADAGRALGLAG